MPKARALVDVDRNGETATYVGGRVDRWGDLNRVDLRKVAQRLGISVTSQMTNGEMLDTLRNGPVSPVTVTAAATPATPATGNGSALETAIRDIAAGAAGVDREAVRSIVDETVAPLAARVDEMRRPLTITVNGAVNVGRLDGHYHETVPTVLRVVGKGLHVMLVGPAGSGKSTIGENVAAALGLDCYAISCGPADTRSTLFGFNDAHGRYVRTVARDAYENGGVLIVDEIDNGHPSVVTTLNMMLANGRCSFPDGMVDRHPKFVVVATANTFGRGADRQYVGRQPLDAATLDRFVTFDVGYDETLETAIVMAESPENGEAWLREIRHYRDQSDAKRLNVIVSPRAAIAGARMLDAGLDLQTVRDATVFSGLNVEAINTLTDGLVRS